MKKALATVLAVTVSFSVGFVVGDRRFIRESTPPAASERLTYAIEQLRRAPMIEAKAQVSLAEMSISGYDSFYLLVRYVATVAIPPDFDVLLEDKSPAVRLAAAMAILKFRKKDMMPSAVDRLLDDHQEIIAFDSSCIPRHMTVGALVAALKRDPGFLDVPRKN